MSRLDDARNKLDELEELAKPLVDYLRKNYHPHTVIVVTDERVVLAEDVMSAPLGFD